MKDENKELMQKVLNRLNEIENRLRQIERVLGIYPPKEYSKFPYGEKKDTPYRHIKSNKPVWPHDKGKNIFRGA